MVKNDSNASQLIRVQVIEPQQISLWGICHLINSDPRFQVCASSTNEADALKEAEICKPHVILIEPQLGDTDVLNLIETLIQKTGGKVLLLCSTPNAFIQDKAILKGARGIVLKTDSPDTLLKALEKIAQGELWLNRNATSRILEKASETKSHKEVSGEHARLATLTPKEEKITRAIQLYPKITLREVAEILHISEHTLRNHLASIYDKLEVRNRLELYVFCGKYQKTTDPHNHPKRRASDT